VNEAKDNSIIVAPEVCLTGFDYEHFSALFSFATEAIQAIKKASLNKTIILTMIEKRENGIFNFVKVFHKGEMVFERAKARLFRFGGEHEHMSEGSDDAIETIELDGVKIALLVCFELRFKELWRKVEGADVVAIPSWWGALRSEHFKTLTQALAIMNQCYVVASDSANEECTKMSGIISPQGEVQRNGNKPCLEILYNKKEITLMRRYMDVGIK
jgi:predicted amidohydrolase